MCGRYAITTPPESVREWFRTYGEIPNWPVYYNAAPTSALPIVRQNHEGQRVLALMQWGLVPWFSKDGKLTYSTINARAESVRTNASYREPFMKRRCLVPASGYFEWTGPKTDRQPHYFTRADGEPTALAGLWDRWRSKDKSETIHDCHDTAQRVRGSVARPDAADPGAGHLGCMAERRSRHSRGVDEVCE